MARGSFLDAIAKAIANDPESWSAPHREAMAFYDYRDRFQDWVSDRSTDFSFLASHARSWERAIEEGTREYTEEDEEEILTLFRQWVANCVEALPDLQRLTDETPVSGAGEFRDQIQAARDYISRLERIASRQRSKGMRGVKLTEAEAEAFRRIVGQATRRV